VLVCLPSINLMSLVIPTGCSQRSINMECPRLGRMLEHYRRKQHRECDKTVEDVIARAEASSESIIVTLAAPPNEIVYANAAWERLCGWRLDDVKGRTCKLLQGPQTCTRALRELEFAIIRRQSIRVQLRNYRKDGDVFSNDLFLEPLTSRGRHGIITHLQGTLRQISDDQLIPMPRPPKFDADELLRKLQEQQPTTLAEAMLQTRYAQVITEPTAPYRIVAVNREWCDTCGFSSEEAIGETCGMLQGPGTCKNTLREISKACEVTPLPPPLPRPRPPLVHAPSPPPPPSHAHHPFSRRAGGTYS
jgi:PAS domain S-box-containing protein